LTTFRVLGPIEAWWDGERLPLGGPRQVTLLAVLLLHANRAVARDELVEVLWGSGSGSGSSNRLQVVIARMRKALEPLEHDGGDPVLQTVGGGYMLSVAPGELDSDLFAAQVQEGQRLIAAGALERGVPVLREAEALWRGPALADVAYQGFVQAEVRRLDELRLAAIEARLDAELALGRHAGLIGELEALAAREPTRELGAGQLALAL
jgi:DNA-binding SARP family transcriptional activator